AGPRLERAGPHLVSVRAPGSRAERERVGRVRRRAHLEVERSSLLGCSRGVCVAPLSELHRRFRVDRVGNGRHVPDLTRELDHVLCPPQRLLVLARERELVREIGIASPPPGGGPDALDSLDRATAARDPPRARAAFFLAPAEIDQAAADLFDRTNLLGELEPAAKRGSRVVESSKVLVDPADDT